MSQVRREASRAPTGAAPTEAGDPNPHHQAGENAAPPSEHTDQGGDVHRMAPADGGSSARSISPAGEPDRQTSAAANDVSVEANPNGPETLGARLTRLERQNRWMKIMLAVLVLAGGAAFSGSLLPDGVIVNKTIMQSQELKLLDSNGTPRLFLRMYSHVPVLQLVDGNGTPRLSLGLRFDDTPFIDLSDNSGRTRATLEMTDQDDPALRLFDTDGETTFQIR